MPGIGSGNPLPFEIGGGPSSTEEIYESLKQAVGEGMAAEDGTSEAEWRMAQARGIRAGLNIDRAMNQGFPHLCTDFIEEWEDMFHLVSGDLSDEERRQRIVDRWVRSIDASGGGIEDDLQGIDPLFSVVAVDRTTSRVTHLGRSFQDIDPNDGDACGPAFGGGREATDWPNYSTHRKTIVRYDLPTGQLTGEAKRRMVRAKEVLREVLPSWADYSIFVGAPGFILDQSLLDVGAFGS